MDQAARGSLLALAAALACSLLTWAWIAFARRRHLHDLPGRRRLHQTPTPRGGGVAIALVMVAALAWLASRFPGSAWSSGLACGIAAFGLVGLIDDLRPLPALAKLAMQLAAAAVLLSLAGAPWLHWLLFAGLVVGCAYFVNVWNFMDGSNGMVTLQALVVALALALWPRQDPELRLAALGLAGACAGFLPFNFPRARVFLGDVGSHALGAAVFGLLWLSWRAGVVEPAQALLLAAVVLLDSGLTLVQRLLAGRKVWRAHREHLYQYAIRSGHSHQRVALVYAAATALLALAAGWAARFRSSLVMGILLLFMFLLGCIVYRGLKRHWLHPRPNKEVRG